MPRRRRRRSRRKPTGGDSQNLAVRTPHNEESPVEASEAVSEPSKIGPGQEFVTELIDVASGHAKRYRNIGTSPLAYAFYRGWLVGARDSASGITAEDRYSAGTRFAKLWECRLQTGVYAFDRTGSGGSDPHWWCDRMADASEHIRKLQAHMYAKNYLIVQRFCGEGRSMPESLHGVIEVHPNAVTARVREALDDLVTTMTGRQ